MLWNHSNAAWARSQRRPHRMGLSPACRQQTLQITVRDEVSKQILGAGQTAVEMSAVWRRKECSLRSQLDPAVACPSKKTLESRFVQPFPRVRRGDSDSAGGGS